MILKKFRRFIRYKTFVHLTLSYVVLVMFSITILSFILFYSFKKVSTDEIGKYSQTVLTQINQSSDDLYDKMLTLSNQLFLNQDFTDIMNSYPGPGKDAKVINYNAFLTLSRIKPLYTYIYSLGAYRLDGKISTDTAGVPLDADKIKAHASGNSFYYYPKKISMGSYKNQELLTFVFYNRYASPHNGYALIINVDQRNILGALGETGDGSHLMVADTGGSVISDKDGSAFMRNISSQPYFQKVIKAHPANGNFIFTVNDKNELITFSKTKYLDWYVISMKPYSSIITEIFQLRNGIIVIIIILVLLSAIFAILFANKQYQPFRVLLDNIYAAKGKEVDAVISQTSRIDEYQILSDTFEKSQNLLDRTSGYAKKTYLLWQLKGLNRPSAKESMDMAILDLKGPYFCTAILKVEQFWNMNLEDRNLLLYAMENVSLEVFSQNFQTDYLETETGAITFLLQFKAEEDYRKIKPAVQFIQKIILDNLDGHFSATIGSIVEKQEEIGKSYRSSDEYIKCMLFYGPDCIVDTEKYQEHLKNCSNHPVEIDKHEKQIAGDINLDDQAALKRHVDNFIACVAKTNYYQAISYCTQIATLLPAHSNCKNTTDEEIQIINKINNAENLKELSYIIKNFCLKLSHVHKEITQTQNEQRNETTVKQVKTYIQEHFSDPGLCMETIAAQFMISPGYLGKLFRLYSNTSFNEYLTNTRLNAAERLLKTTDKPILEISKDSGIYNVTYFSTLFKKNYSISPSAYREAAIADENKKESIDPD